MWPATTFLVARGSIQKNLQIRNFLYLIAVKVGAEANLNRVVTLFHSKLRNYDPPQNMDFLKVAPDPNQLPTPGLDDGESDEQKCTQKIGILAGLTKK